MDEPDPPKPDRLWVNSAKVTGEVDGFGVIEIEAHMFDNATREYLGCSSLEPVDASDVVYDFELFFVRRDGQRLEPPELFGRDVVIEVIEDDADPCPSPPGVSDDPVGTSPPIRGDVLGTTGPISFGNVSLLLIRRYPEP